MRILRPAAALLAVVCFVHAALQGVGAAEFWSGCFTTGPDSAACLYAQYEAPDPWWTRLQLVGWPLEAALAVVVVVAAFAADARRYAALAALACVAASNLVADYVLTPLVNGGIVSADNPPGYGLYGAVLLAAAGVFAVVTALPASALPARPVSARDGCGSDPSPSTDRPRPPAG